MKAYKCDICGDYYEGYTAIQVPGSDMKFNKLRLIRASKNDLSENVGWKDYDICPTCARVIASLVAGSDEEIQKMQDLEQAQIEKAYQLGYDEGKKVKEEHDE